MSSCLGAAKTALASRPQSQRLLSSPLPANPEENEFNREEKDDGDLPAAAKSINPCGEEALGFCWWYSNDTKFELDEVACNIGGNRPVQIGLVA